MKRSTVSILLLSGLLIPLVFWSATIIAAVLHGDYNHFQNTVSQLGAIGSRSEDFMTIATWICTVLGVLFFVGLLNACHRVKLNGLPLLGILGFSIMFGWAATFHAGHPMHSKAGPALLPLLVGPLLSAILWKGAEWKRLRRLSLLSFAIMLLILLRAIPSETIQKNYTGLVQRFVHLGWTLWFVSLSFTFLAFLKKRPAEDGIK